jgi:DNA-binding transcriptional regulator GbsR (MarR family)
MSKGSASQGLRFLRTNGAIKLVYVAGDRRDHFEPETELRALVSGFLREKVQPHLDNGGARIEALQALARSLPSDEREAEEAVVLQNRLDKLKSWQRKGKTLVPIITKLFG